ncbi:MAG: hypothetical protein OXI87_19635 [Albidovulum sp.]|nr:hypothetical protein [Albidovulum sp.]
MKTPAILGVHEVTGFHGQSSPEMARSTLMKPDLDKPLLDR